MKPILKWTGRILGGVLALIVFALAVVYGVSERRMRRSYEGSPAPLAFHPGPNAVKEGERLAVTRGCADCHGKNLAGTTVVDDPALGRLVAANLTRGRGGVGAQYTDAGLARAIREGIGLHGRSLLLMPSSDFKDMSDEDVGTLVAYIRSLPPVDTDHPANRVGPLGRILYLAGQIDLVPADRIDHTARHVAAAPKGPTVEYGKYLAGGCTGCHGAGLSGGKIPGGPPDWPAAGNITPDPKTGIGSWTEQDFFHAIREGRRPDGSQINPFMPWKNFSRMTDDEIRALWLYLRTVPPKARGNR